MYGYASSCLQSTAEKQLTKIEIKLHTTHLWLPLCSPHVTLEHNLQSDGITCILVKHMPKLAILEKYPLYRVKNQHKLKPLMVCHNDGVVKRTLITRTSLLIVSFLCSLFSRYCEKRKGNIEFFAQLIPEKYVAPSLDSNTSSFTDCSAIF